MGSVREGGQGGGGGLLFLIIWHLLWNKLFNYKRESATFVTDTKCTSYKYSFHKKLGLRLATNYSWCLLNKPLHISKADTKILIGGFQAKMRGADFIPFLGWNTIKKPLNRGHSFICTWQCILLSCDTVCDLQYFVWLLTISVLTALTTLYANSLWTPHDIYANRALGICKWSMQKALTHKGQAALWVTNGCTSMSNPITTQSTPMGVDNNCLNWCLLFPYELRESCERKSYKAS